MRIPTTRRITPTTLMSRPLTSAVTAEVRIAPAAIRINPTATPITGPCSPCSEPQTWSRLAREQHERPRDLGGVPAPAASSRVLVELHRVEAGAGEGGDDLAKSP